MLLEKAGAEVSCCEVGLRGECCNSPICLMSEVLQLQGIAAVLSGTCMLVLLSLPVFGRRGAGYGGEV